MTSQLALGLTLAIWASPFLFLAGWLIRDRRDQQRLRNDARTALDEADDVAVVEVRPHLYIAREATVIDARDRFAARRAVGGGLGGGSAA